jgi:exopolyphosphatase/guanosine-5'-triphosphate,3'-diphosphate pyrophosphatase
VSESSSPESLAAVDLGSNSFHMVVARLVDSEPAMIDRIREQVQLRAGLDADRRLTRDARDRALACLDRFGQRLRGMPGAHVRVVGTNTLRRAKNAAEFLEEAEAALGHPIEILSGAEEARLIYLGVSHTSAAEEGSRLVVDIGGGSTECILGVKFEPRYFQSLEMGCVSFTQAFFPDGSITRKRFDEAETAARLELRRHQRKFRQKGWGSAFGASGTIRAVRDVLRANEWSEAGITPDGLKRLRRELLDAGHVDRIELDGLKGERAPVFAGGVAILTSVFSSLKLERMEVSSGALREGVLYDLMGRLRHEDVRDRTIRQFEERYRVDTRQANLVEGTALEAFDQAAAAWGLEGTEARRFLGWAARLHEIGLTVSYEKHHRHGAYLVANSDMPGFSRNDQALLSSIIASHRRRIRRGVFDGLSDRADAVARRLTLLLRLAVRFHRTRDWRHAPEFHVEASKDGLAVVCDGEWLAAHPMTRRDLEVEAEHAADLGVELRIEVSD